MKTSTVIVNCTNITYVDMKAKTYYEKLNDFNSVDYSAKTTGSFRRQLDIDHTHDNINKTDWKSESNYFNYYHNRAKANTIKMPNKEWHRINNTKQYQEWKKNN